MESPVKRWTLRMIEQGALWFAGALLVLITPLWFVGIPLLAVVYARNLEFMHECLHATALPRPRANVLFGQLLGVPMFVSFERWRREHMRHHANVRIEGFRYEYERLTTWSEYVVHALMLRHFADTAARIARFDPPYRFIVVAAVACIAGSIALHTWAPVLLWIAPLPLAAAIHTHIELPEHFGLHGDDPLRNSRVIPAGPLLTWFVNANNYHAIHHWQPRLPIAKLRGTYDRLPADRLAPTTYTAFFRAFYAGLGRHDSRGRSTV